MAGLPKWLRDQFLLEDAIGFGTAPSVDHIVRRAGGVPNSQSPEDFLRSLMRDARLAEEAAARSVDSAAEGGLNMFGGNPRTLAQARADAMRQFPEFDNLPIEDAALLMDAIQKGAILKGMPVFGDASIPGRPGGFGGPKIKYQPANRTDAMTGDRTMGSMFGMDDPLTQEQVLGSLGNKANYVRAGGRAGGYELPPPPAFTRASSIDGPQVVPSEYLRVAGDDVSQLARTLRQDQVDSRVMQAQEAMDEMNLIETQNEMARAADAVAAKEAYARQYGGFDPETRREMDRLVRRDQMERAGTLSKLTNDPLHDFKAPRQIEMEAEVANEAERQVERALGNDIIKGVALGHVLSYPAMYAAYRYTQGDWPFSDSTPEAKAPTQGPAVHLGEEAARQDDPFMAAVGDLPTVPVELPDMPVIRTPETQIGLPEDDALAIDSMGDDAELAAESTPIPEDPAMDKLLAESGLINKGTSPEMAARRRDVWRRMKAGDDLNTLMREAGLGGYEGDLSKVDRGYLRRRGSVFSPDSLNYALEREYRRRGGNPYPQLRGN